ncbi:MAG: SurA N-terminal domain-containing protein [Chloroflexia bacterium]
MADSNPYEVLQVSRYAEVEEIEEAYNDLFDQYEASANEGDEEAIATLHALNDARDTLVDPRQRAAVDARLFGTEAAAGRSTATRSAGATSVRAGGSSGPSWQQGTAMASGATARSARAGATYPASRSRSGTRTSDAARRPRSVAPVARRSTVLLVTALILFFAVVVTAAFLVSRGNGDTGGNAGAGNVVATVNGVPIYMRDYQERLEKDKANAMNDPLVAGLANNFQGITGTRMLDVISFDALDKLINMEVIQQEAKKEKLYPTSDAQKKDLIEQAKQNDLNGKSFDQFLREHNITEEQYNNSVIANTVYAVMASKYMPQTGTDDAKTQAFISWICDKRKAYDVKINLTFTVAENKACSSGLPSDVPLTGDTAPPAEEGTQAPQPESTLPAPVPTVP